MKTPERPLHGYVAKASERPLSDYVTAVCERTDVRVGVPLPLGTYAREDGVNFAIFSRHASRVGLELFDDPDAARLPGGLIWILHVTALVTCGIYGWREFVLANSTPTGWTAPMNSRKDTDSIPTDCSWTHLPERLRS